MAFNTKAQVTTIPTFECIGIYWSPEGGSVDKDVLVNFREAGTSQWQMGLNMKYNPQNSSYDGGDYRGSIVKLKPDTKYEIQLTLKGTSNTITYNEKTWTENFPIGKTIYPGNRSTQLTINKADSGSASGYILYDGQGDTIDVNNTDDACIYIKANYVIIRNYVLTSGKKYGIYLEDDVHDVIIEGCDISNWGQIMEDGWGTQEGAIHSTPYGSYDCGVYKSDLARIVVQRNKIHHPRSDANSWAEGRGNPVNYHPIGPQAVIFVNPAGNNVIRYNEVWSDENHMYNDIIGGSCNQDWIGYPGPDSDIYGNYLSDCWDEAIEAEGGGRNVRIWGNYMENLFGAIAAAGTRIGPIYAWNNVSGRSYSPPGSEYWEYGIYFKQEYDEDGIKYVFNNTILQPNGQGTGGIQTVENSNGLVSNMVTRNNVLQVKEGTTYSIGYGNTNDFDFDLCNKNHPFEPNGLDGTPIYVNGAGFDHATMTGNYTLDPSSPGYDAGTAIPNFKVNYNGNAPDMGASEAGEPDLEYGVNAYQCTNLVQLTSSAINGQVNPPVGSYCKGSKIQFTATPDVGYKFETWGGDFSGSENPIEMVMNTNLYLEASFSPLPIYKLTTKVVGNGHVSAAANGDYFEGDQVKIIAFPSWQQEFLRWEGDVTGTENTIYVSIDSNINITAVFTGESNAIDESGVTKHNFTCYPNPFTDETSIRYELKENSFVELSVLNLSGQTLTTLISNNQPADNYFVSWNGNASSGEELPAGVYFIKLKIGKSKPLIYKIILAK